MPIMFLYGQTLGIVTGQRIRVEYSVRAKPGEKKGNAVLSHKTEEKLRQAARAAGKNPDEVIAAAQKQADSKAAWPSCHENEKK